MASTYANDLRIELQTTGENSGSWGTRLNSALTQTAEALSYGTKDCFATDADQTITVPDGTADASRALYLKVTSSATLTATRTMTIGPNTISRLMFIENATTGSQSITISQGTGASVTIATAKTTVVYFDGAGAAAAVVDALALVDPGVTDTLAEVLVAGNATGGTDIATTTTDKVQFRDAAIYINSSTDGQLDIVADTEIQLAATTVDLNGILDVSGASQFSSTITVGVDGTGYDVKFFGDTSGAYMLWDESADDLKLVGAAGLTVAGDIDVDGTSNLDILDVDGAVDMASTLQVDGAITSSTGATITVADNSDNLTLTSTDADANAGPSLVLYRNSGSPADGDLTGRINFHFEDDGGNQTRGNAIFTKINDASNGSEDAEFYITNMIAGTERDVLHIYPTEIVLNEDTVDLDFRVESDGNANMLFVDGGNDRVGVGIAPTSRLEVQDANGVSIKFGDLASYPNNVIPCFIGTGTSALAGTNGDLVLVPRTSDAGKIVLATGNGGAATEKLRITTGGAVFNEGGADVDFRVESSGNANMLFVDGGADAVGIGVSDVADAKLVIQSTGVDGTYANVLSAQYSGNSNEHNVIGTTVSSTAANSGFIFKASDGGGSTGTTEVLKLTRAGAIFNDGGADQDFRVESSGNANMLFVDGGSDRVGIGTGSPSQKLQVAGNILLETSGNPSITNKTTGAGNNPTFRLQADTHYWDFQGTFSNANDELMFMYDGSSKLTIDNSGNVGIGTTGPKNNIQVNTAGGLQSTSASEVALRYNMYYSGGDKYIQSSNKASSLVMNGGGEFIFYNTNSASTAADSSVSGLGERMRILPTGGITFNGDTATANALDDYEEGTWTPVLNRVGASTVSYTEQLGYYTKIGRKVSVDGRIEINAVAAQGSSVNYISGIPFALGGTAGIRFVGGVGINYGFDTAVVSTIMGSGGESNITFRDNTNTDSNLAVDWVAGGIIAFSLEYFVD